MRIISSQSFFLYAARPTVISTGTKQSGVEWRNLRSQWHQCLPSHCHFDRNGAKRSGVEWRNLRPNGTSASPSHCHFDRNRAKRSGVEWRNLRSQRHSPIAVGDFSAQSLNGVQIP